MFLSSYIYFRFEIPTMYLSSSARGDFFLPFLSREIHVTHFLSCFFFFLVSYHLYAHYVVYKEKKKYNYSNLLHTEKIYLRRFQNTAKEICFSLNFFLLGVKCLLFQRRSLSTYNDKFVKIDCSVGISLTGFSILKF